MFDSNSRCRVALITGASSGFGRLSALTLAAAGWRVFGAFRGTRAGFTATAHELADSAVESVKMDVTDDGSVHSAVDEVLSRAGRIDAVVTWAGFGLIGPMECTPIQATAALYDTNVFGTMRVCRAVLPVMRAQGSGHIVTIGSDVGLRANYFQSSYAATKFAVDGFSQALRLEVRRFGITVSLLSPGWYDTEFGQSVVSTSNAGDNASVYARLVADWEAGVGAVEGPNDDPQEVADQLLALLENPKPRYRNPVGWNGTRMGIIQLDDIDTFQDHLVDYYRMESPEPTPALSA